MTGRLDRLPQVVLIRLVFLQAVQPRVDDILVGDDLQRLFERRPSLDRLLESILADDPVR